jgi:predicted TIM-barrel fold metal-dependent hydrolase
MYDGPIIDAHHHIWEVKNYPWLLAPMEPKLFGDYEPLRHDYLVEDLLDDIKNQNVEKSVHIQANWGNGSPVEETRWLQAVADQADFPHGIVAFVDLTKPEEAESLIEAHKQSANMRGIRHQTFWHDSETQWRSCEGPEVISSDAFRESFKLLKKHGLSFDLQMFPFQAEQLASTCDMLKHNPDVPVILCHAGMLPLNRPEMRDAWQHGLAELAGFPNLFCKISGLALLSQSWGVAQLRDVILTAIELFGIERCIFGSNFPLERMWASYDELLEGTKQAVSGLSPDEQRQLFHDNAEKFYRI